VALPSMNHGNYPSCPHHSSIVTSGVLSIPKPYSIMGDDCQVRNTSYHLMGWGGSWMLASACATVPTYVWCLSILGFRDKGWVNAEGHLAMVWVLCRATPQFLGFQFWAEHP